jgi:uncharacterized protein YdhG (YjbR/CyaY superfamily)
MKKEKIGFETIDEYIGTFPHETQKRLVEVQSTIQAVVPNAREKISYRIAAFELNGKNLIYFAGWKKHISIYPIPPGDKSFNQAIAQYADGKGTLKFPLDKPLPLELIRKVVEFHVVENLKSIKM